MAKQFRCRLTKSDLRLGTLNIPSDSVSFFPSGKAAVKIMARLGDSVGVIELTYQPQFRMVFGLKGWYLSSHAKPDDTVLFAEAKSGEYVLTLSKKRES